MAKNMKKMLAIFMVMVMFVSVLPLQVLAAEGEDAATDTVKIDVKVQTSAGEIDGTKTTTTSTDESGTTTTTITVTEAKKTETTGDPASSTVKTEVAYKETKVESVTTNANGDPTATAENVDGAEIKKETTTTTESSTELVEEGKPETKTEEVEAGSLQGSVDAGAEKVVDTATPDTDALDIPEVGDKDTDTVEDTDPDIQSNKENPDVIVNEDGSTTTTTTTTTTTVDTIIETTVTDVDVTDRELITGELTTESETELGEVQKGDIVPVDGSAADADWSQVDASTDEGKALIELAKKIYDGEEIGEVSEADKAVAEALAAEAKKENGDASVKALLGLVTEEETELTASIENVSITVDEKAADDNDGNADNDVYKATVEFEIHLSKNILGTTVVTIVQGGKVVAREALSKWNPDVKEDGANSYKVQLEGLELQEGTVDMDITLEDVDELTTEKVYVATVDRTYEQEIIPANPDTTVDRVQQTTVGKNKVNDVTGNWDGASAFTYEVTGQDGTVTTITVTPGENNTLTISANHTIEMNGITLNTPFGTIEYEPADKMLVKDQAYTISGRLTSAGTDGDGFASTVINNANQDKIQLQTAGNSSGKLSQIPDGHRCY